MVLEGTNETLGELRLVKELPEASTEIASVLASAFVLTRVVVTCPALSVLPENGVRVFPVPVEVNVSWVALKPLMALLKASFSVNVRVRWLCHLR